jgi:hypothetical protein
MNKGANFVKLAFIKKVKGKGWCVFSHKAKNGKYRNFGCYKTQAEAKKRLGQIYFFKGRGALDGMVMAADLLDKKGMLHLSDAVVDCLERIISMALGEETEGHPVSVKLGKVTSLLESKGELELAESLDNMIPDIITLEAGDMECPDCPDSEVMIISKQCNNKKASADRLYAMASKFRQMYREGLIDEDSFEYSKYKEIRSMLSSGLLLSSKHGDLPDGAKNWWEYFELNGDKTNG